MAYYRLRKYAVSYVRYPVPFGWLAKVFMYKKKRIIHYVGDPVDAARNNPVFHEIKRKLLLFFFKPENFMYSWACRGASVYTNGYHIAERLKKRGIEASPIISSTLNQNDFHLDAHKQISEHPSVIYVGYLRKTKGVETIINGFALLRQKYPNATLTIVGGGEFEQELRQLASKVPNINFVGHVDDRNALNALLRQHDLFCFASLSEGSPRVILEAMANGINVVSTPVGSLPHIFKDGENILFADYNNAKMFCDKMIYLVEHKDISFRLRESAFHLVQNYTIANFLKEIFYEA
jgi:glycosyltransferase involved in cell wall biosynthesis